MAKLLGIVLFVLGVWVGAEVLTQGTDGAFGGLFARIAGREAPAPDAHVWAGERAGDAVGRARDLDEARRRRLLGE